MELNFCSLFNLRLWDNQSPVKNINQYIVLAVFEETQVNFHLKIKYVVTRDLQF